MALAEHAVAIEKTLGLLEESHKKTARLIRVLHRRLAECVAEHGEAAGINPATLAAARAPKTEPDE